MNAINLDKRSQDETQFSRATARRNACFALSLLIASLFSGCASWTNPVANGIPVRFLRPELLAEPKEDYEFIPWGLLQRTPPEEVVIQPEDVLGIYVVGVLGTEDQLPPVQLPDAANVPPALGFPIPVQQDGTIPLPFIDDPIVAGLTVLEAQKQLVDAYTGKKEVLKEDQTIILTMIRPKTVRVLVVRQDSLGTQGQQFFDTGRGLQSNIVTATNSTRRGSGFELQIPAREADVLSALANTGGLPGLDVKPEILIYRNRRNQPNDLGTFAGADSTKRLAEPQRIQLKVKKGETPRITERDVSLQDGDIVVVDVRKVENYYTTGLMFNREVPLPLDYDLTVIEAVARGGGPLINGGFGGANLNGNIVGSGIGNPNPTLLTVLRQAPNGRQIPIRVDLAEALRDPRENILVKNGDVLVLQESTGESFARYLTGVFSFNRLGQSVSNSGIFDATQTTGTINLP